jgi:type I restriction enzyme S subunit
MTIWKSQKIKEICTKIGSGATPKGGDSAYISEGISLIRSQNVLDFTFSKDGLAFIDEQQAKGLANVTVQANDVLLNITGDSVARVCQVPEDVLPARVNQHVAILRADTNKLVPEFLKYALLAKPIKELLLTYASTGATRKALTKGMLEEFEINLPDLSTQQKIAEILSSLDDKIELNRRMNQTLEQMAQTLFRQYFVDGIDADNLPEGWREGTIGEIYKTTSGGTPSREKSEYYGGEIPWVKSKELNGNFILHTEENITVAGLKGSSAKLLPAHSVLVAMYGATVGEIAVLNIEATCNQAICAIIPNENYPYTFIFEFLKIAKEDLINRASGSAQQNISQVVIQNFELIIPPVKTVAGFNEKVESLYEKIISNEKENQSLTNLRDTLLLKLMSGEIEVMQTQPAGAYEEVLS